MVTKKKEKIEEKKDKKNVNNDDTLSTSRSVFEKYKNLYVVDGYTMCEIADDYELNYASLRTYSMRHNWGEARRKYNESVNKTITEKIEERGRIKANELLQKNYRRAKNFRMMQKLALSIIQSRLFRNADDDTKTEINMTPKELRMVVSAYNEACKGEMLQDGQAIEITTISKEEARNPVFEAIARQEDLVIEAEDQLKKVMQENEHNKKIIAKLKNANSTVKTQS